MAKPYPHKQTVVIFILCAAVVVATAAYVNKQSSLQNDTVGTLGIDTSPSTTTPYIATNTDWEKAFYGTSTSTAARTAAKKAATQTPAKLTTTDKFGRELFSEYTNLKRAGKLDDQAAVAAATQKLLGQDILLAAQPQTYSKADIRVSQQNDLASFREYGNQIGSIVKNAPARNDAYIASEGVKAGTVTYLKEIDSNIEKYKLIIKLLLETRVPSELAESHVDFLNGISTTLFVASSLRASDTDPIKALAGLNSQLDATTLLFNSYRDIRESLADMGVTYATGETGMYFNLKQ
jgi:hypothetical protein